MKLRVLLCAVAFVCLAQAQISNPPSGTAGAATSPFTSSTANPATTGILRCANNEACVSARNAANSANLGITLNTSNLFAFDAGITTSGTFTSTASGGGTLVLPGATSGTMTFQPAAIAGSSVVTAPNGTYNLLGDNIVNTGGASMTLNLAAGSATAGLITPVAAGAAPIADGAIAYDSTKEAPVFGGSAGGSSSTETRVPVTCSSITSGSACQTGTGTALDATNGTAQSYSWQYAFPANYCKVGKVNILYTSFEEVTPGTATTRTYFLRFTTPTTLALETSSYTPGINTTRSHLKLAMLTWLSCGASGTVATTILDNWSSASSLVSTDQPVTVDTTGVLTLEWRVNFGATTAGNTSQILAAIITEAN
jgi:hypothetical protein